MEVLIPSDIPMFIFGMITLVSGILIAMSCNNKKRDKDTRTRKDD